jgi:hypothetical protein
VALLEVGARHLVTLIVAHTLNFHHGINDKHTYFSYIISRI